MSNWVKRRWMEGGNDEFAKKYVGVWPVDYAVYNRAVVVRMLEAGEISTEQAEELLRMRYVVKRGKVVVEDVAR